MEVGTTVAGRYTIESLLGRGGMGSVWVARDEKFGERIALKVANASGLLHEEWKARFVREARLGNRLGKSEGFVRAFDWGEVAGVGLYLAMDLIVGARALDLVSGTLDERLGRLRAATRLVAAAHAAGVVHRDLKPANLLQGSDGKIWLADFGLAKVAGESEAEGSAPTGGLTASGVGMGTPEFMPPEQFEDSKRVDERADVYALGVMLFAALTGRLPYDGAAPAILQKQTRVALGAEPEPRPSELAPGVNPRLEELCRKAIALDRTKRLASAGELLAGLDSFLTDTIKPTPPKQVFLEPKQEASVKSPPLEKTADPGRPAGADKPVAAPGPDRSGRVGALVALGVVVAIAAGWQRIEGFVNERFGTRSEPELGGSLAPVATTATGASLSGSPPPETTAARVTFEDLHPSDRASFLVGETRLEVRGRLSDPSVGRVSVKATDGSVSPAEVGVNREGRFFVTVEFGGPDGGRGQHTLELRAGAGPREAVAHMTAEVCLDWPTVTLLPIAPWRGGPLEARCQIHDRHPRDASFGLVADGQVVAEASATADAKGAASVVFAATTIPRATRALEVRVTVTNATLRVGSSRSEVAIDRTPPVLELTWPPEGLESRDAVFVRARVAGGSAGVQAFVVVDPGPNEIVKEALPGEAGQLQALVHLPAREGPVAIEVRAQLASSDVAKERVVVQRISDTTVGHELKGAGADPGLILGVGRAKIVAVVAHSAAAEAGLVMGDVIGALDGENVANAEEVSAVLRSKAPRERTRVSYVRDGVKAEALLVTGHAAEH